MPRGNRGLTAPIASPTLGLPSALRLGSIMQVPVYRVAALLIAVVALRGPKAHAQEHAGQIATERVALLVDGGATVLARPSLVSVDRRGRFVIEDRSDKNIKVYDGAGQRVGTFGRPGGGPGEFASLQTAQVYRDSIITYDFAQARLTVFTANGQVARTASLLPPPWRVRVVDDSLLLFIDHPARGGESLRLMRFDGTVVSSFFNIEGHLGDPRLRQHSVIFADARDGVVFAGFFGGDSLYVFDYAGRRLAAGGVDPTQPLTSLRSLAQRNRGEPRRADGSWVHDGARTLINVVALSQSRVALHVAPYDAKLGTDPLEGGTLLIMNLAGGRLGTRTRASVDGAPIGRDRGGELLLLKYTDASRDGFVIERIAAPLHQKGH